MINFKALAATALVGATTLLTGCDTGKTIDITYMNMDIGEYHCGTDKFRPLANNGLGIDHKWMNAYELTQAMNNAPNQTALGTAFTANAIFLRGPELCAEGEPAVVPAVPTTTTDTFAAEFQAQMEEDLAELEAEIEEGIAEFEAEVEEIVTEFEEEAGLVRVELDGNKREGVMEISGGNGRRPISVEIVLFNTDIFEIGQDTDGSFWIEVTEDLGVNGTHLTEAGVQTGDFGTIVFYVDADGFQRDLLIDAKPWGDL